MAAVTAEPTGDVEAVKFADCAPAATATLAGTITAATLLDKVTLAPPAGAAAGRSTEHALCKPPVSEAGVQLTDKEDAEGKTTRDVDSEEPASEAVNSTSAMLATAVVEAVTLTALPPGTIFALAGTETAARALARVMVSPAGAGAFRRTSQRLFVPPLTGDGLQTNDEI
jgi:hypothetical protein